MRRCSLEVRQICQRKEKITWLTQTQTKQNPICSIICYCKQKATKGMGVRHAVSERAVPVLAAAADTWRCGQCSLLKVLSCSHLPWSFLKQNESASFQGLFYMDSYGNNAAASCFLSQKELFGKKSLGNLASPHNSHSY